MRKPVFKADPNKGGFVRATLAPCGHKEGFRFGWGDMAILVAIILVGIGIARLLLAH